MISKNMKLSGSTSFFVPFQKNVKMYIFKEFLISLRKTERRHKSLNDDQVVVVVWLCDGIKEGKVNLQLALWEI